MSVPRVAIIGGGISGLTAVYRLQKLSHEKNQPLEVVLYESGSRTGGILETERAEGYVLEKGPDSFITDKPWAIDLALELGLGGEIIPTHAAYRRSFIARGGKLLPVPGGFYLVAPVDAWKFLGSPIVSWPGKMRMMAEIFVPRRKETGDESVASFVRRRFGREALDRVAQPMIGGIYTGDPENLSLTATMPRFLELEKKYGSLLRGLRAEAGKKKTAASGPRYGLFVSFRGGMQALSEALERAVPPAWIRKNTAVRAVRRAPQGGWTVETEAGESSAFDAACLALPASLSAKILKNELPAAAEKLASISYESVLTLNLAYRRDQIRHPLDGFGFVVPKTEKKTVIACSFSSRKFEGRAPESHVLLRAFVGGVFGREDFEKTDAQILSSVEAELAGYLGIQGKPGLTRLRRYPGAMVQYALGHPGKVAAIREALPAGLYLTGAAYDGIGLPDCVRSAGAAAAQIFDFGEKNR